MSVRRFDTTAPTATAGRTPARPIGAPAAAGLAAAGPVRLAGVGAGLLEAQRRYGNRFVQRIVQQARQPGPTGPAVQAKLVLGRAGDRFEREADRLAAAVTRAGSRTVAARRASAREPVVQAAVGTRPGEVGQEFQEGIRAARAGGQTIPAGVRAPMERAFGADFRGVRLHTDARADRLSRALGARAFTTGRDIFFRRGEYEPGGDAARRLLAHELTHVVQQNPSVAGSAAAAAGGDLVQRAFPAAPHAGDLAEINRVDNRPLATIHKDQGVTSRPTNYRAPGYRVTVTTVKRKGKQRYRATVEATHAADTGDCEATYLKSGAHDSGFRWGTDPLYDNQPVSNRLLTPNHAGPNDVDHVIFNVSAGTARRSKAAEQEHLDDYHYAFGLTLGAAEESIQAVAGRSFSGTTGKAARTQAEAALRAELVARSNGNLDSLDPAAWQAGYRTLFMRSGSHRDGPGYHIQTLVESPFWNKPLGRQLSRAWRGHGVRHVDVVPGATFRLGVPSRDVVDPHANQPAPGTAVGRAEEHQGDDER